MAWMVVTLGIRKGMRQHLVSRGWRAGRTGAAFLSLLFAAAGAHAADGNPADPGANPEAAAKLAHLSIEELGDIEITSVSKRTELLSDAAASVYVITADDIRRSGATSIPEILRLAPNLQVARVDASQYAITARGFNSTTANKLLVLIDGRSVYTPLYSGVFWDVQDIMPESIERIEVISGPGGTLWGANAVNGVINIISRHSKDTTGTLVSAGAGNDERNLALRHGGKLGEDGSYRLYAKGFSRDNTTHANGTDVQDSWDKKQVGFRTDWQRGGDAFMVEGNAYDGKIDQAIYDDKTISGSHVIGRWNRALSDRSSVETQAYYDRTKRNYPGTFGETLETWDIYVQHRFPWGEKHDVVWGGGYRLSRDDVTNSALLAFLPAQRNLALANVFMQDTIALAADLQLTLGGKLEHNSYTGLEFQPNARLAWKLPDQALLWSALSRSVRTPSRIDAEFFAPGSPPFTFLVGNPDFQSEIQTTFEVGYRMRPKANASFSISAYYNAYDKLRSVEPGPPLVLANKLEGNTYGIEMWGTYRVNDWWRLSAGYNYMKIDLRTKPGSGDVFSAKTGTDPSHQFSLRSSMNLASNLEFDLALRSIGTLPNPYVPGYTALDARLGWQPSKDLEISLTGSNLLDPHHMEFGSAQTGSELKRSFHLGATWKF
jgi:iron complex outermembrane recepter protein